MNKLQRDLYQEVKSLICQNEIKSNGTSVSNVVGIFTYGKIFDTTYTIESGQNVCVINKSKAEYDLRAECEVKLNNRPVVLPRRKLRRLGKMAANKYDDSLIAKIEYQLANVDGVEIGLPSEDDQSFVTVFGCKNNKYEFLFSFDELAAMIYFDDQYQMVDRAKSTKLDNLLHKMVRQTKKYGRCR